MIKTIFAVALLGGAGAFSICNLCPTGSRAAVSLTDARYQASSAARAPQSWRVATLQVQGMTCGGCVIGVRRVLTRLDGVVKTKVTYEPQRAVVTYDPARVTVARMIAAIETLGYKATPIDG